MYRGQVLILFAVVCITLALTCGCRQSQETLVPGQAKLMIDPGDSYAILSLKADGSSCSTLSVAYDRQAELRWSPNGKTLAWSGLAWGNWDLYSVSADGLTRTPLSDDAALDSSPAWSPDGKLIADCLGMDKARTKGDIGLTNTHNGFRQQLAKDDLPHGSLDWAHAGDKLIAFTTKKPEGWIIETFKGDGSERKQLAGPFPAAGKIAWSPDGTQLAAVTGTSLVIIPAAGGASRPLAQDVIEAALPRWSPDGSMIALLVRSGYKVLKVADGSPAAECLPAPGGGSDPTWSPDSKQIAFSSSLTSENDLFLLEIASKQVSTFASTEGCLADPAWSPDGKTIAVAFAPPIYAKPKTE